MWRFKEPKWSRQGKDKKAGSCRKRLGFQTFRSSYQKWQVCSRIGQTGVVAHSCNEAVRLRSRRYASSNCDKQPQKNGNGAPTCSAQTTEQRNSWASWCPKNPHGNPGHDARIEGAWSGHDHAYSWPKVKGINVLGLEIVRCRNPTTDQRHSHWEWKGETRKLQTLNENSVGHWLRGWA